MEITGNRTLIADSTVHEMCILCKEKQTSRAEYIKNTHRRIHFFGKSKKVLQIFRSEYLFYFFIS